MGWNHGNGASWRWVEADTADNSSVPGQTVISNVECAPAGSKVLLHRIIHCQQRIANAATLPIDGNSEPYQNNMHYRALVGEFNNGVAFDAGTIFWDSANGDITFGHFRPYGNRTTVGYSAGQTAPDLGPAIPSYPLGAVEYGSMGSKGLVVGAQPYEGAIHGTLVVFEQIG